MSWFDDFDWKSALKVIAPTVAGLVAAPVGMGPLANAGVRAILDAAFPEESHDGLTPPEMEQKLSDALASGQLSPEQIAAMKQADYDFQKRIAELNLEELKVDAADRDSARKREMEIRDWVPGILACVIITSFIAAVAAVLTGLVNDTTGATTAALIGAAFGYLSAKADTVTSYYFGSSRGSRQKTDALAEIAKDAKR